MTIRTLPSTVHGFSTSELFKESKPWLTIPIGGLVTLYLWDNHPQILLGIIIAILALVAIDVIVAFAVRFGPKGETMDFMAMPAVERRRAIRNLPEGN